MPGLPPAWIGMENYLAGCGFRTKPVELNYSVSKDENTIGKELIISDFEHESKPK